MWLQTASNFTWPTAGSPTIGSWRVALSSAEYAMTANVNRDASSGGFLGLVRRVALAAVLVGAAGSFGLMLRAGQPAPRLLLGTVCALGALPVLWPFYGPTWFRSIGRL